MTMDFSFFVPTKIQFGSEALAVLVSDLKTAGYRKIGLVYDNNLASHPHLEKLRQDIAIFATVIDGPVTFAEPTYKILDNYRQSFMGSNIQAVVGVGGGSSLDTAKAVAVLVNNKKPAIAYRGFDKMTEPVLPIYAVPTTAGTGSEITPNASFVDDEAQKKLGINGEAIRPCGAYLDPGFIITCPEKPSTYAAIDALVHAVEAFAAKKSTPMAQLFAREAVHLVLGNIVDAVQAKNVSAIEKVFMGSLLAGMAMMHSGTGPAAALSYPLGVHLKVPHGLAGGIFLPQLMRWNVERGYYGYAGLSGTTSGDDKLQAERMVEKFFGIWGRLNIPSQANTVGLRDTHIAPFLVDLGELRGAIDQNPIAITEDDLRNILSAHI
jgi:alcohol dehydrogenase